MMRGIILAGGMGSRLFPLTLAVNKQLLPIHDKPMIYYSLSILMLLKIKDLTIISDEKSVKIYQNLFQDGYLLGMSIHYQIQSKPNGLPEAFLLTESFIKNEKVCLILGDNVFYGRGFGSNLLLQKETFIKGARIFPYYVNDPQQYGVVEFSNGIIQSIEEKPQYPKSNFAIPGLYFFDETVTNRTRKLTPSKRGELEITDLIKSYYHEQQLSYEIIGRGTAWLDTGSFEGLSEASIFVQTIQKRTGLYVSCIEEIAYRNQWINRDQLLQLSKKYNNEYGRYLKIVSDMHL
jgi:glucose-1-phosphate thymidylyltransferase